MSRGSYEYESSGGLMPMIRALVKPPDELMNPPKPKKPHHPYYKRPGKGHNRDCCDACNECGDLICCDRCPASFHLTCLDPPLEVEDIPAGLWLCKVCRATDSVSGDNSCAPTAVVVASKRGRKRGKSSAKNTAKKKVITRKETSMKDKSKEEDSNNEDDQIENQEEKMDEESAEKTKSDQELTPMELLIKAAKVMNPKQFEMPREMKIPIIFPGTKKGKIIKPRKSSTNPWGNNVPPPAKECYVCHSNSKNAPLLQCDYCPLVFHQDCLNPPLTSLPIGRWMCPNHVEQFIDWKMVNSISATERVALWDKFAGPVDQHAIKVDFLRRARRCNPAFRIKVAAPQRGRVVVPLMVQQHYLNPPPLLPSRREFVRCSNVLRNLKASGTYDESEEERDMDENSKHKICMNMSCPEYTGKGTCPLETTPFLGASKEEVAHDLNSITEPKIIKERVANPSTSDHSDSDLEQQILVTVKKRKAFTAKTTTPKNQPRPSLILREDEDVEELIATADEQLKHFDHRLVKLFAWQRMQQIATGEQIASGTRRTIGSTKCVDRSIAALKELDGARHQTPGVNMQVPSDMLEQEDRHRIAAVVLGERPQYAPGVAPTSTSPRTEVKDAFIKATLLRVSTPQGSCNISKLVNPIPMRGSSLRVGSQMHCDLVLDGKCRRVSPMHAIIFHDQVTNHFELLNYSEWGSQVNGVMFACDISPRPAEAPDTPEAAADARASVLRNLVRRHIPPKQRPGGPVTEEPDDPCTCPKKPPNTIGAWEGSAIIPHGALIQFGCYRFVFSISNASAFPYESKNKKPAL